MKKVLAIFTLCSSIVYGQVLEANDVVIELNFGFPNMRPLVIDPSGVSHSIFDFGENNSQSFGQFIIKGEFFMADKLGIVGSVNYGYFKTYDESQQDIYNGTTAQWTTSNYYYTTKVHKFRIAAGINFHFLRTERLDTYFGVLAGTKKAFGTYETNDPNAAGNITVITFPFALRTQFGIRYFITEYLAANLEFGLGGPLISFGATYKF